MNTYQLRIFSLIFLALTTMGSLLGQTDSTGRKPNVVLILVDDSGLMDFGAFGGEARTPNIDRLAGEGFMFTNMHASPVCAPSRAMLLLVVCLDHGINPIASNIKRHQ